MRTVFKGLVAAGLIAGSSIAAIAPAEARYHGYHHGDRTGTALLAGAIGLGVGAAIASDRYDRGGYDYYGGYEPAYGGGYGYAPVYYAPPPVVYYGGSYGYYGGGYRGHYDRGYRGGYGRGYGRGGDHYRGGGRGYRR